MLKLFDFFRLRKYQVNPEGGMIYVDRKVEKWLDSFKKDGHTGKSDVEIDLYRRITKSGIDDDQNILPPKSLPKISLVVVTYNSNFWMDNLNKMFSNLGDWLYEIIVVDNGSIDNCVEKLISNEKISIIKNEIPKSFAAAVNQGCRVANGDLFLIINPDVFIPKSALFSLINFYLDHPDAGAIVPKLMLMRTPGFINGVGNIVPFFRWGYDLGLGHLDVGQFDHIEEVPSACFATVLIPKTVWARVGELDEDYPMYYEDSDWSCRVRVAGLKIILSEKSIVFHGYRNYDFGFEEISSTKLMNVTYGRLRYTKKNIKTFSEIYFLISYLIFDIFYIMFSMFFHFNFANFNSIFRGWKLFLSRSKTIQKSDVFSNHHYIRKNSSSKPHIKYGIPKLTWNMLNIRNEN